LLRRFGQEVIRLTAGKRIHDTGAIPGGVNKSLNREEVRYLQEDMARNIGWAQGALRAKDVNGDTIFDHVNYVNYNDYIRESVKDWSYMKFPFITSLGEEEGWYRVGPLARINNCDYMSAPLADAERKEFMALGKGLPVQATRVNCKAAAPVLLKHHAAPCFTTTRSMSRVLLRRPA